MRLRRMSRRRFIYRNMMITHMLWLFKMSNNFQQLLQTHGSATRLQAISRHKGGQVYIYKKASNNNNISVKKR